jgi:hypothetical protein
MHGGADPDAEQRVAAAQVQVDADRDGGYER